MFVVAPLPSPPIDMLGRLAARPFASSVRLAQRTPCPGRYPFYPAFVHHAPPAQRNWSSSSSRKEQDKDNDKNADTDEKRKTKARPAGASSFFARARVAARWTAFVGASSVVGVLLIGATIFAHDAFTYTERHVDRVPVNPLALHPETGGPKNLPVAKVLVGDEEDDTNKKLAQKPRLVIVGGGWGVRAPLVTSVPFTDH